MTKKFSEEEVKALWEKAKPSKEEEEALLIRKIETLIKETKTTISKKGISSLYPELDRLKKEIVDLRDRVEKLESEREVGVKEITIKEFPPEKTKELVANYLKKKGEAFPSEIADELGLSIVHVMDAIRALQEEKKVGEV